MRVVLIGTLICSVGLATQVSSSTAAPQPARQPNPSSQPEPAQPAKISGRVVNAATSEPLRRANLTLMPAEAGPESLFSSTTTDADGRFGMTGITPGKY